MKKHAKYGYDAIVAAEQVMTTTNNFLVFLRLYNFEVKTVAVTVFDSKLVDVDGYPC